MRDNTTMDPRRLREETRAEHEATEAVMPLGGDSLTREVYVRTLETLYPVVASWESWAARAAPLHLRPLVQARKRGHLLAADLRQVQGKVAEADPSTLNWSSILGSHSDEDPGFPARFLGGLYVMEGSTLGGQYLARHVEEKLDLVKGQGNSYFQGHGGKTGAMWREVTAEIATVPDDMSSLVVDAAKRTFRAFGTALQAGVTSSETTYG